MRYRPHRYPTEFPVMLHTPGGMAKAVVTDINQSGARIAGNAHLRRGDQVVVAALNEKARGIVRWVGKDKIGISFTPMISERMVDHLRFAEKRIRGLRRYNSSSLQEMR